MTKTDFAELKEKLCRKIYVDIYVQREHDSAIISELIEIISFQDNKISELLNYLHHNEDNLVGDDLIGDQRFTKRFNNYTKSTSDVLSETTTRLQKLRDGNNGK